MDQSTINKTWIKGEFTGPITWCFKLITRCSQQNLYSRRVHRTNFNPLITRQKRPANKIYTSRVSGSSARERTGCFGLKMRREPERPLSRAWSQMVDTGSSLQPSQSSSFVWCPEQPLGWLIQHLPAGPRKSHHQLHEVLCFYNRKHLDVQPCFGGCLFLETLVCSREVIAACT